MAYLVPAEFDLHIWKRPGINGKPDLFTIGAWDERLTIRSLGHILQTEEALVTLRHVLETAGQGRV